MPRLIKETHSHTHLANARLTEGGVVKKTICSSVLLSRYKYVFFDDLSTTPPPIPIKMSNVYSTEPQSTAQVVFETTHGPLSIHLFAKECPSTVRYFLQLCLDGYFNNLPFHRVMPGFLIQTGDASFRQATTDDGGQGGGDGGERNPKFFLPPTDSYRKRHGAQEALDRRRYELNSRIRFNHRGQVAMALTVEDSEFEGDNRLARLQSQFFVTLDEAGHLDGNHVVFGGVSGPTIFNAIRMGKTDSDESTHQPHVMEEAPRILKTKVQSIDGLPDTLPALVPTPEPPLLPWNEKPFLNPFGSKGGAYSKRKKKARKGVKNVNLLSFGEEMTEEEEGDSASSKQSKARKIQSSHELLASSTGKKSGSGRLVPKVDEELERRLRDDKESNGDPPTSPSNESVMKRIDDSKAPKTKEQERAFQSATEQERTQAQQPPPQSMSSVPAPEQQFASAPFSEAARKTGAVPRRSKQKKLSLVEARRAKYAKGNRKAGEGKNKQLRQEDTMKKLIAFQRKVVVSGGNTNDDKKDDKRKRDDNNNDGYHGQILEDNDYNADKDWIKTKFKCRRHMDADAKMGGDGRAASDYEVVEEHHSATDRKRDRTKSHHRP